MNSSLIVISLFRNCNCKCNFIFFGLCNSNSVLILSDLYFNSVLVLSAFVILFMISVSLIFLVAFSCVIV